MRANMPLRSGRGLVLGIAILLTACGAIAFMLQEAPVVSDPQAGDDVSQAVAEVNSGEPRAEVQVAYTPKTAQKPVSGKPPEPKKLETQQVPDKPVGGAPAQGNDPKGNDTKTKITPPADPAPEKRPEMPLLNWKDPAAVLVFTGELRGYLEPCGCSVRQLGGLGRRGSFLNYVRDERKIPTAAFDIGGSLSSERITRQQTMMKFDVYRKALSLLKYDGLALGREELMLGGLKLFTIKSEDLGKNLSLPWLGANLTIVSKDIFPNEKKGFPANYTTLTLGGQKIAVTSILGDSRKELFKNADPTELKIDPPKVVLASVLKEMAAEAPDLRVLLAHAETEEAKELAKLFPELDIVVSAGGPDDPPLDQTVRVGKTLFVETGRKGKHVAVVGLFPKTEPRLKFEVVELDKDRFPIDPTMRKLMVEYFESVGKELPDALLQFPSSDTFVGAQSCEKCHKESFDIWAKSKHAHALQTLVDGRPNEPWTDRSKDPECLACHVTGMHPRDATRFLSGFVSLEKTPHLADQQCENCHGPANTHVTLELAFDVLKQAGKATQETADAKTAREMSQKLLHRDKETAFEKVCASCHDHDNSPAFNKESYEKKYWPDIAH